LAFLGARQWNFNLFFVLFPLLDEEVFDLLALVVGELWVEHEPERTA
jgi:hypothetical protein